MKKLLSLKSPLLLIGFCTLVLLYCFQLVGLRLVIDLALVVKIYLAVTFLISIINLKDILQWLDWKKNKKKIIIFTLLNLFVHLTILFMIAIFSYGNLLVFEDKNNDFIKHQEIEISDEVISQEFRAKTNNLGRIAFQINRKFEQTEFDEAGDYDEVDNLENYQYVPEQEVDLNQTEDEIAYDHIDDSNEETKKTFNILFRIREKDSNQYFYEHVYEFTEDFSSQQYQFGFPVQKDSKDKNYVWEVFRAKENKIVDNSVNITADKKAVFYLESGGGEEINYYPIYSSNLETIKKSIISSVSFIFLNKIKQLSKINPELFLFVFMSIFLQLSLFCLNENNDTKQLNSLTKIIIIFCLLLLTFNFLEINFFILISILTSLFYLLLINKDTVKNKLRKEKLLEIEIENQKSNNFEKKINKTDMFLFSKKKKYSKNIIFFIISTINNVFVLITNLMTNILKTIYKEGIQNFFLLLMIILIFTLIKVPYFDNSFTGEHSMKYSTHVEPTKYMLKNNNPFWNQKRYLAHPINNPDGILSVFSAPPLIEWGLLIIIFFFPKNSIEFNTRVFMNFLGVVAIILIYLFFKKWFTKKQSLLICFLLSINSIFNLIYYVTVLESFAIIFAFLSLLFLSNYIKKNNIKYLFLTSLFFAIGVNVRYSLFLWLFPIILMILVFNIKKINTIIKIIGWIILTLVLVFLAYNTSLKFLPKNPILFLLLFLAWLCFFIIIYFSVKKFEIKFDKILTLVIKNKIFLMLSIMVFILFLFFLIINVENFSYATEFLTDRKLIFNIDMYIFMIRQLKNYLGKEAFYLGLVGCVFSFIFSNKLHKSILSSFILGSAFFWISASKSIFFHNYYTGIIMITFCLSISSFINVFNYVKSTKFYRIFFLILLFSLIIPNSYKEVLNKISREKTEYVDAVDYLEKNTKNNSYFIDGSYTLALALNNDRGVIDQLFLEDIDLKNTVSEIGFKETMNKYNIEYLISFKKPDLYKFASVFTTKKLVNPGYRRSDLILSLVSDLEYFPDLNERKKIIEDNNLNSHFFLEKEIGEYRFYRFQ